MTLAAAIDCHMHIFGSAEAYPFDPERRYAPAPAEAERYWTSLAGTPVCRAVIVQPSVYGTDNSCLLDALASMSGRARGVAVLQPEDLDDAVLAGLHASGVRGLRLNTLSNPTGGRPLEETLVEIDAALAGSGWHIQVFCAPRDFDFLTKQQQNLSGALVLDHFGFLPPDSRESERAALLRLVGEGAWIKLSGTDRLTRGNDAAWFADLANEIAEVASDRILWGSDWPHTPLHTDPLPDPAESVPSRDVDTGGLFHAAKTWFPDAGIARKCFLENPAWLYDFPI
ncbi:amidohydrolase family protein [Nisaea acidiphila]|uniref:Amidohydrolase family protein n=1 Tax=Nisaea acidiphila TaxID=1862145 RepID=A0A9J7ATN5_9PROT|nr:amidohydrolase family protein [Nisaea acidiphila]UUX50663.1 amidohydrolase family protein [Nisaea acidiphila]